MSGFDPGRPLMGQLDCVRFVVISDVHATQLATGETNVAASKTDVKANALIGARDFLQANFGKADFVLCPGDLVHFGDAAPVKWVWQELRGIAAMLGAQLVGSVGNHDLTRTPKGGTSPADALRLLAPRFPFDDLGMHAAYWGQDLCIVTNTDTRVVTMNSCALHGGFDPDEADFGRFRPGTLDLLPEALRQTSPALVNVCMVHHHPIEWTHAGDKDQTHLRQGDLLIKMLEDSDESWVLVHGHKHHPRLIYLGSDSNGPVCLAAGSIGADVLGDTGTDVRNQMHVMDVVINAPVDLGLPVAGEIHSYDWEPGSGWAPATPKSGLPHRCGFGFRRDGLTLGLDLARWLAWDPQGSKTASWSEILEWDPRWDFLTPRDRSAFLDTMVRAGGTAVGEELDATLQVTLP